MAMSSEDKIKRSLARVIDSVFQLHEVLKTMKPADQDAFIEEVVQKKKACKHKLLKDMFALEPLIGNLRDTVNGEQKARASKQEGGKTLVKKDEKESKSSNSKKPQKDAEESKEPEPQPKPSKKTLKDAEESKETDPQPKPSKKPQKDAEESKEDKPLKKKVSELKSKGESSKDAKDSKDAKETKESKKEPKKAKEPTKKTIPSYIKTLVWNQYVGEDMPRTRCLCCRKSWINYQGFHCGHVIAEANGGDLTITNLRPICAGCNLAMKTENMNEFAKRFFGYDILV